MNNILASFYPTTILMVDDNSSFLKSVIAILDDTKLHFKPFDSPHFALDFLNHLYTPQTIVQQSVKPYQNTFSLSTYQTIYNFSRFTNISTLLIDYEMPGITGVEFCNSLNTSTPLDCIMLTGVATLAVANKAMTSKIVSHFMKKNDLNFVEKVMELITESQTTFFRNEVNKIVEICNSVNYKPYVFTPEYQEFFNDIIIKQKYYEYYLIDGDGSYLMIDADKNLSAVFVWNKKNSDEIFNLFAGKYELSVLNKLASGENIICFPYRTEQISVENLGVFIKPAIKYNDDIHYVYVQDATYFVKPQHITFFDEYKAKIAFSEQHFSTLFNI